MPRWRSDCPICSKKNLAKFLGEERQHYSQEKKDNIIFLKPDRLVIKGSLKKRWIEKECGANQIWFGFGFICSSHLGERINPTGYCPIDRESW